MPNLLDGIYALALAASSPYWAWQRWRLGKYRQGWWHKLTGLLPPRVSDRPAVWLHAVSVGEVLVLRPFLAQLRSWYPQWQVVLTVSTQTGFEVARKNFPELDVFYAPLDFTWAIRNAFDRIRPNLILLVELELWPNWLREAQLRQIPVAVINARISPRSYRGYRWLGRCFLRYTRAVRLWAVQNATYAQRLHCLGVPSSHIIVTGSMKFDGVNLQRLTPHARELVQLLGLQPPDSPHKTELVWVAGSTQEPEEEIILRIYARLLMRWPQLRLILVPRHRERFDAVAHLVQQAGWRVLRRSQLVDRPISAATSSLSGELRADSCSRSLLGNSTASMHKPAVLLVDTIGELAHVWGLADVAFVGGSFGDRGGQNMLEPAALGVPVLFGPNVWNFQEIADLLCEQQAAIQVRSPEELEKALDMLLSDPLYRAQLGQRAREFVLANQGAVSRTLAALQPYLGPPICQLCQSAA